MVPVLQQFLFVPPDTKMRLRALYRLSEAVVSVILATVTSEAGCEDKLSRVTGCETVLHQLARIKCGLQISLRFLVDASINTGFCGYIGGKLDTEDTSVRQKQVRKVLEENILSLQIYFFRSSVCCRIISYQTRK